MANGTVSSGALLQTKGNAVQVFHQYELYQLSLDQCTTQNLQSPPKQQLCEAPKYIHKKNLFQNKLLTGTETTSFTLMFLLSWKDGTCLLPVSIRIMDN